MNDPDTVLAETAITLASMTQISEKSVGKKFKFHLIPKRRNSQKYPPSLDKPIPNPYGELRSS